MEMRVAKMLTKAGDFLRTHYISAMLVSAVIGVLFSWGGNWILPSKSVNVKNLPKKELTCTLDFFYMMVSRRVSDEKLQIYYDGNEVKFPYAYSITIKNTGEYAISNEDFKDPFSIDFKGSNKIVHARVSKSTNQSVIDEVLSNAKIEESALIIEDFFLNVDEFFTVHIISDGKPDTISYSARIADMGSLILRNTPEEKRDERLQIMVFILGGMLLLITILITTLIIDGKKAKKSIDDLKKQFIAENAPQELQE